MEERKEELRFPEEDFHFNVFDALKAPKQSFSLHRHDALEIDIVLGGHGINYVQGMAFPMSEGDFFLFNPLVSHMAISDGSLQMKVLVFDKELILGSDPEKYALIKPFFGSARMPRHSFDPDRMADVRLASERIQMAWNGHRSGDYWLVLALLEVVLALVRENSLSWTEEGSLAELEKYSRIRGSIKLMEECYAEPLTLEEIASCSNMSSGYFCSFFRKVMNVRAFEYLGMVRIKAACIMLKTSDRPVVDICMDCGFENLSSFNHSFRKMMDCTPSTYRRR
ncbi:MAG: AraC family transcriptional regulator [Sphaerochaetaceae bacterium]